MAKPQLTFVQGDACTLDWKIEVKWPESAKRGVGTTQNKFKNRECFVAFKMLADSDSQALLDALNDHNRRIADAKAKAKAAATDEERAAADQEQKDADAAFKSWRIELLRTVVVGFPDKHGFDAFFKDLPDFAALSAEDIADYVEAFADLRPIGKAMEDGYWAMVNGGKAGN